MMSTNFVTKEVVGSACSNLRIRDWSSLKAFEVSNEEARAILDEIGGETLEIGIDDFREGLQVELEHGTRFPDANITNNHPILTARIVLAHLKESLLYYKRIAVAELEGDLLKATRAGHTDKMRSLYQRIALARLELDQAEVDFLKEP
ncbi:MAG: hypothetical protein MUP90_15045 [Gammaproteobacteria bacterium]|nr:hypothetical protein [Gammaproteobacteria bacterium]